MLGTQQGLILCDLLVESLVGSFFNTPVKPTIHKKQKYLKKIGGFKQSFNGKMKRHWLHQSLSENRQSPRFFQ
jgi:hypothetical protein